MYIFTKGCIVQKAIKVPLECIHYIFYFLFLWNEYEWCLWWVFVSFLPFFYFYFFEKHSLMSLRSIQPSFVCICAVCLLLLIWPVGIRSAKSQKTKIPLCSGRDPNKCVCGKWIQSNVAVLMPCCLDLPSSFLTNAPPLPQTQPTLRFRLDGTSAKLTSRCLCQLSYIRSYTDFFVYLGCTTMKNLS